jgi:hypothetical protein
VKKRTFAWGSTRKLLGEVLKGQQQIVGSAEVMGGLVRFP